MKKLLIIALLVAVFFVVAGTEYVSAQNVQSRYGDSFPAERHYEVP